MPIEIPLADIADVWLAGLADATGAAPLARLDGGTLLGERAALSGLRIPGSDRSAGGGCILFEAEDDTVALNLARPDDRDLLPALFETTDFDARNDAQIGALIAARRAWPLVQRGREMGLAIAAENEKRALAAPCVNLVPGPPAPARPPRAPRVLDLSALWAGPLAAHLLWYAGAEVTKVESLTRPDAMREGDGELYARLSQGKAQRVLDFGVQEDVRTLLSLIADSDIVIEAARPRALAQLGIDASSLARVTPGLVWMTITAHGASGAAADWVGFGDDCGVAAGLSAALRRASGRTGFVGDAIADPLTGIFAARVAWEALVGRRGGRYGLAMSAIAAAALSQARDRDPSGLEARLAAWGAAAGEPFPKVCRARVGAPTSAGAAASAQC